MRVKLSKRHLKILFNEIIGASGSWTKIASEQGVSVRTLNDWKRGKITMPFETFKRLSGIVKLKKADLSPKLLPNFWHIKDAARKGALVRYKKYGNPGTSEGRSKGGRITCQKFLLNPQLAKRRGFIIRKNIFYPSQSTGLAEFIGIILGDGGITNYQVVVTLNKDTDKEYANYVNDIFKNLFRLEPTIKEIKDKKVCCVVVSSRNLVEYLENKHGLKAGDKIRNKLDIPLWIKLNKEYTKACLRGLFDTDGCFYIDKHYYKKKIYYNCAMNFTNRSFPILFFFKTKLEQLGFHPTRNTKFSIVLRRENEIIKYFQTIGSSNLKHLNKFKGYFRNKLGEVPKRS